MQIKKDDEIHRFFLAGGTGLEPATNGFGDRRSTN